MKKICAILLSFGILCAGIWCAAYVSNPVTDCHSMSHMSTMCSQVLEHGSIISSAILTIFTLTMIAVAFVIRKYYFAKFNFNQAHVNPCTSAQISGPPKPTILQTLFSQGILHPRKP